MANTKEAKIVISGEAKKLKEAVKESNSALKSMQSELKLNEAQFQNTGDKTAYLNNKHKILSSMLEESKTKQEALNKQLELAQQAADTTKINQLTTSLNYAKIQEENLKSQISKCNSEITEQKAAEEKLKTPLEQLNRVISEQENDLEKLKTEYKNVALEQGTNSKSAKELKSKINSLNQELSENKKKFDDVSEAIEDSGEKAKESADGYTVVKNVIANMATEALDSAKEGFKELALEGEASLDKLQAKVGASQVNMQDYSDIVQQIYEEAWGDSLEDVSESLGTVINMTDDLDKKSLKTITENAMTLRDVYDMEILESMRAVNSLMDQFGISADEAFNLIVLGVQNGLNQNDDLLDTINEYSVQFKIAGFSADNMFNMLINGAETGTWSIDKLGDAFKEFNIRMSDGTANEALKALGLNASKITAEYAKGGESAQNATQKVIQALMSCDDPQKQYIYGQQIMGTMWEDLGADAINSLMNTNGEISKTTDAMGQVKTDAYDNLNTSVSTLGRSLKNDLIQPLVEDCSPTLSEIVSYIKNDVIPTITETISWLKEHRNTVKTVAAIVGILTGVLLAYNASVALGTILQSAHATSLVGLIAAKWAENSVNLALAASGAAAMLPLIGIVAIIAAVIAIIVVCVKHWDKIKKTVTVVSNVIKNKVSEMYLSVVKSFAKMKEKISKVGNGIKKVVVGIVNTIISSIENCVNRVVRGVNTIINGINKVAGKVGKAVGLNVVIPTLKEVSLPRVALASGGIAYKPITALIAEGGEPEAVAPVSVLKDYIIDAVEVAIPNTTYSIDYNKLAVAMANMPTIVQLNNREVGRVFRSIKI